ncbi:MAG: SWIM zinc finger family protein [Chlorobium sp.]
MAYYWYKRPTLSTPRAVTGGIKAQNKRGAFGQTWWGKQWITTLESFDISDRITRGKSYARKGQVTDLVITAKKGVAAKVQGSRVRPYKVSISLTPYSKEQKELLAQKLTAKPIYIAQLLSGEMPENLGRILKNSGLSLFPAKYYDLTTTCSCPDYSNPCKHIAAVFYLMAEAFDQDPFLLFTLRGVDKEEFLKKIGYKRQASEEEEVAIPEPLPSQHGAFWDSTPLPEPSFIHTSPAVNAAMVKRLGSIPYWRSTNNFINAMEVTYAKVSLFGETLINTQIIKEEQNSSKSDE